MTVLERLLRVTPEQREGEKNRKVEYLKGAIQSLVSMGGGRLHALLSKLLKGDFGGHHFDEMQQD